MAITRAELFTSAWSIIFNLINNNVTVPGGKTKSIYSEFPKFKVESKANYPLIVIPNFNASESIVAFEMGKIEFRFSIEVYSLSSKEADEIANDIFETIEANIAALASDKFFNPKFISRTNTGNFERDGTSLHGTVLEYSAQFGYGR